MLEEEQAIHNLRLQRSSRQEAFGQHLKLFLITNFFLWLVVFVGIPYLFRSYYDENNIWLLILLIFLLAGFSLIWGLYVVVRAWETYINLDESARIRDFEYAIKRQQERLALRQSITESQHMSKQPELHLGDDGELIRLKSESPTEKSSVTHWKAKNNS